MLSFLLDPEIHTSITEDNTQFQIETKQEQCAADEEVGREGGRESERSEGDREREMIEIDRNDRD